MKIIHPICFNAGMRPESIAEAKSCTQELAFWGVEVALSPNGSNMMLGQVSEDHPHWPEIEKLIQKYNAEGVVHTEFTQEDLLAADYVMVRSDHPVGYPQPQEDEGYCEMTYDASARCAECHIGEKQPYPLRIKKDPSWGKYSAMTLFWIMDQAILLKTEVWEKYFKPEGVPCRPVVVHGTGLVSDKVVQLDITHEAELDMKDMPFTVCTQCKRKRYDLHQRGYFPRPLHPVDAPMFKSAQSFGTGGFCYQPFFISNAFYRKLADANLKGLVFEACKPK